MHNVGSNALGSHCQHPSHAVYGARVANFIGWNIPLALVLQSHATLVEVQRFERVDDSEHSVISCACSTKPARGLRLFGRKR